MRCFIVVICGMDREVRRTSLPPNVDEKLVEIADKNQRTISNQIAEFVKDGVSPGRYVVKGLDPELEAEMVAAAKKENRNVENFIETALKVYLKRVEYVPILH